MIASIIAAVSAALKPVSAHAPRRPLARQRRKACAQGAVLARIIVAIQPCQHQRSVRELPREELEQQQRRSIGRVQIVEHNHHRPRRRLAQQPGHRVEELKPRPFRLGRRARGATKDGSRYSGINASSEAHPGAAERAKVDVVAVVQQRTQDLHPRPVRRCPADLPAPAPHDPRSALEGV